MKSKKDKIIDAAIDLFADKGFHNTSTAEIATNSDVAQGTLFYHFKNKEGILYEVLRQVLEQTSDAYRSIDSDSNSGYACIEALLRSEIAIVQEHSKEVMVLIRDMTHEVHRLGSQSHELIHSFLQFKINLLCRFLHGVMHTKLLKHLPVPPLDENAIQLCLAALTSSTKPQKP